MKTYRSASDKPGKARRYRYGRYAEVLAALYLMLKGYRPLKWRYKTPVGEVDLIVRKRDCIVLVEVKARRDGDVSGESISPRAKARIARAGQHYMKSSGLSTACDMRFDAVLIGGWRRIVHVPNAWDMEALS